MIEIVEMQINNELWVNESATLISHSFPHAYPTIKEGREVVSTITEHGSIALVAIQKQHVIGIIGAIPQYGVTGWELHPLAVDPSFRKQNIGRQLVEALEEKVRLLGGVMIYLGTDDEFDQTSLSGVDLFDEMYEKIKAIENHKNHPYSFYVKCGYQITGLMPDANGLGRPDIIMSKRIVPWVNPKK
jgi:aminoglycoside 6'-N-acetyltransferase I